MAQRGRDARTHHFAGLARSAYGERWRRAPEKANAPISRLISVLCAYVPGKCLHGKVIGASHDSLSPVPASPSRRSRWYGASSTRAYRVAALRSFSSSSIMRRSECSLKIIELSCTISSSLCVSAHLCIFSTRGGSVSVYESVVYAVTVHCYMDVWLVVTGCHDGCGCCDC